MIIKDLDLKSYLDDIFGSQKKKSSPSTPSVSQIDFLILQHKQNSEYKNTNNLLIIRELENKEANENYDQTNYNYNSSNFKNESQLSKSKSSVFEKKSKPSLHEKIKSAKSSKQKLIFKQDNKNKTNKISSDTSSLEGINFDFIESLLEKHEEIQKNENNNSINNELFENDLVDKNEFCGFKTAKGTDLILNPVKVKKAEQLLFSPVSSTEKNSFIKLADKQTFLNKNPKDLTKEIMNDESNFMGFKTARGNELSFNPKNLMKAEKILLSPQHSSSKDFFKPEGDKNEPINFVFKTGKGQLLKCNPKNLKKAEKILLTPPSPSKNNFCLEINDEIENNKNVQNDFMGFKTAKGRDLKFDDKKFLKAEKLLFSPIFSQKEILSINLAEEKSKKIVPLITKPSPSKLSNNSSAIFFTAKGSALNIDPSKIAKANQLFSSTLPPEKSNFLPINPLSLLKAQKILASPASSPQKIVNSIKPNPIGKSNHILNTSNTCGNSKSDLNLKNQINNVTWPASSAFNQKNNTNSNGIKASKTPSKAEKEEEFQLVAANHNMNMTPNKKLTHKPNNFYLEENNDLGSKDKLNISVLVPGGNILKSAKKVQEVEGFFTGKGRKIEVNEDKVKKAEKMLYVESVKKKKEEVKSSKKSEDKELKNRYEEKKLENEKTFSKEKMQEKTNDFSGLKLISEEKEEKQVLKEEEKVLINFVSDGTKIVEETTCQKNVFALRTPLNNETKRKQTSRKRMKRTSSFKKFFPSEKKNIFNDFSFCAKIFLKDLKLTNINESNRYLEDTDADTAFRFCFICDCAAFSQGLNENCICNGKIVINHEYFFAKLAEKFNDFTISQDWVKHHYRHVIWKLGSYVKRCSPAPINKMLNVNNVYFEIEKRFASEIKSKKSIIYKIINQEDSCSRQMILLIGTIKYISSQKFYVVELTDGWYSIFTIVFNNSKENNTLYYSKNNSLLLDLINTGKIYSGLKIHAFGLEKSAHQNLASFFDFEYINNEILIVNIFYNSISRVDWRKKLGWISNKTIFLKNLNAIRPNGGMVPMIDVFVLKKYPLLQRKNNINSYFIGDEEERINDSTMESFSFNFTQNKRASDKSNEKQKCVFFKVLVIDSLCYYKQDFSQNSTVEIIFTLANVQMYEEIKEGERLRFMNMKAETQNLFRKKFDFSTKGYKEKVISIETNKFSKICFCYEFITDAQEKRRVNEFGRKLIKENYIEFSKFSEDNDFIFRFKKEKFDKKKFENEVDYLLYITGIDMKTKDVINCKNLNEDEIRIKVHSKVFFQNKLNDTLNSSIVLFSNIELDNISTNNVIENGVRLQKKIFFFKTFENTKIFSNFNKINSFLLLQDQIKLYEEKFLKKSANKK